MYRLSCLLILSLLTLASCKPSEHAIDLSLEFNRQQYKIKGFPTRSRNTARPNLNVMLMWMEKVKRVLYDEGLFEDSSIGQPDKTIASFGQDDYAYYHSFNDESPYYGRKAPDENNFPEELYALGGVELVLKASKDGDEKINLLYLEIPLYALYLKELTTGRIYGGLGPWFAYGLGGKSEDISGGVTNKFNSFDKELGFKRFDAGLGITAGYSFPNGIDVRLDYSSGFANIGRENEKITNKTFGLHAMYMLKAKK